MDGSVRSCCTDAVPRIWSSTVEQHRADVRSAVMAAAIELATERGVMRVTMAAIAERAGIGRATLYKYFSDVEAVLVAWHDETAGAHLGALRSAVEGLDPMAGLRHLVDAHAEIVRSWHSPGQPDLTSLSTGTLTAFETTHQQVADLFIAQISAAQGAGEVRTDLRPSELAAYVLAALEATQSATSKASARRITDLILASIGNT